MDLVHILLIEGDIGIPDLFVLCLLASFTGTKSINGAYILVVGVD